MNKKDIVGRSRQAKSNLSLIEKFSPQHRQLFSGDVEAGWNGAEEGRYVVEENALARPLGADCLTELADGTMIAASRLGTVLIRSSKGIWRAVRGQGIESLLCVTPVSLPNAEFLAVGELGTILRKPPGIDKLLPVDGGDLPMGNLLRIEGNAEAGWFVLHEKGDELSLLHSRTLEAGQWRFVRKETQKGDLWNAFSSIWMWRTNNGFGYTVSNGPIHIMDFATGEWTERATPKNERIAVIIHSPNGTLGALTAPRGGFSKALATVYFSKDDAQSWVPAALPFKSTPFPIMRGADGTVPIMHSWDGTMHVSGGSLSEAHVSKDEGKTWTNEGRSGRLMSPLKSGGLVALNFGVDRVFSIIHSADGGKNWEVEYSTSDRRADGAANKKP
ncbi:exo-alpha-sialidase [Massilia glaciei]|nr:exo-alpha-sialidase [Massilia glaciei]